MQRIFKTTKLPEFDLTLYSQTWKPEHNPQLIILLIHGLGEHCERYEHLVHKFIDQDFLVHAIDLPGHGKTSGKRSLIKSFDICNKIIQTQLDLLKKKHPKIPVLIYGHSMGGSIVANYVLKLKPKVDGIILSSAALKISDDISPILVKIASIMGKICPTMPTIKLDSNGLSHNHEVVKKYNEDPLVYSGKIPARTAAEINKSVKYNQSHASEFSYPILMIHGSDDKLTDPKGSEEFYSKISSSSKTLKIYDGLFHELINEYEQDEVMLDIIKWINTTLNIKH
jgi:alpha-beta hydrolase superfamily lysophospholipase